MKADEFIEMFSKNEILEALFNDREFRFARMQIRICRVLYEKKSDKLLAELEKTGENFQKCKTAAQWVENNKKYERIDKQLEKLNKDFETLEVQIMREILFKAKLKGRNQWIEGFYCSMRETTYCFAEDYERHPVPLHHLIAVDEMTDWGLPNQLRLYEIDPETLCEYTGLTDKNGKKIFENDIVKEQYRTAVVKHGEYNCGCCNGLCGWHFEGGDIRNNTSYEVTGNTIDNPELLV